MLSAQLAAGQERKSWKGYVFRVKVGGDTFDFPWQKDTHPTNADFAAARAEAKRRAADAKAKNAGRSFASFKADVAQKPKAFSGANAEADVPPPPGYESLTRISKQYKSRARKLDALAPDDRAKAMSDIELNNELNKSLTAFGSDANTFEKNKAVVNEWQRRESEKSAERGAAATQWINEKLGGVLTNTIGAIPDEVGRKAGELVAGAAGVVPNLLNNAQQMTRAHGDFVGGAKGVAGDLLGIYGAELLGAGKGLIKKAAPEAKGSFEALTQKLRAKNIEPAPGYEFRPKASKRALDAEAEAKLAETAPDVLNPTTEVAPKLTKKQRIAAKKEATGTPTLTVEEGGAAKGYLTKKEKYALRRMDYEHYDTLKQQAEINLANYKPGTAEYNRASEGLKIINEQIAKREAQHPIAPTEPQDLEAALRASIEAKGGTVPTVEPPAAQPALEQPVAAKGGGMPRPRGKGRPGMALIPSEADLATAGGKIGGAVKELSGLGRSLKLGADMGALLRQGGEMLVNDPIQFAKSVGTAFSKADKVKLGQYYKDLDSRTINGQRMSTVRNSAGLRTSMAEHEEGFAGKILGKFPGITKLENFQRAFLDSGRIERFDAFYRANPDATAKELQQYAAYLNSAMGKSNLPQLPGAIEGALNTVMTSPRWTASRWEMAVRLMNAANPIGGTPLKAALGNKAAKQELKNLGRYAAVMYGTLRAAESAGYSVNFDPYSPDFLKVRNGESVYDPSSGVAMPIRAALRLMFKVKDHFEGTPNTWKLSDELGKIGSATISPTWSNAYGALTGEGVTGHKLTDEEKGLMSAGPLIASGFFQTLKADGPQAAVFNGLLDFVGINTSRYPAKGSKDANMSIEDQIKKEMGGGMPDPSKDMAKEIEKDMKAAGQAP